MKEITIRLYDYDELTPVARKRAIEEWRSGEVEHFLGLEVENTLDKLREELGIKVSRWSYSPDDYDIGVIWFTNYSDDQLALAGRRAQAFLWNRFARLVVQPRKQWYAKSRDNLVDLSGRIHCEDGWSNGYRKSKVFFDRTCDGTCPLTGVCFDNDALDPLANFCLGVEWDEKAGKRVMIPQSKRAMWAATTVEDVIRDCVGSLMRAARDDWKSQFTEEFFADYARNNELMFDESGHMRDDV